jgi:hypothetical protein
VTIVISDNVTVRSVQCSASLRLNSGNLTVTSGASLIQGVFTAAAGRSLSASGAGTTFTANGPGVIDHASFYVSAGARLSLPGVRSFTKPDGCNGDVYWQASGAGSVLELPGLTNVVYTGNCCTFYVRALAGG